MQWIPAPDPTWSTGSRLHMSRRGIASQQGGLDGFVTDYFLAWYSHKLGCCCKELVPHQAVITSVRGVESSNLPNFTFETEMRLDETQIKCFQNRPPRVTGHLVSFNGQEMSPSGQRVSCACTWKNAKSDIRRGSPIWSSNEQRKGTLGKGVRTPNSGVRNPNSCRTASKRLSWWIEWRMPWRKESREAQHLHLQAQPLGAPQEHRHRTVLALGFGKG